MAVINGSLFFFWSICFYTYLKLQAKHLSCEKHGPCVVAVLTFFLLLPSNIAFSTSPSQLFSVSVTMGVVIAGFCGVSLSVLLGAHSSLMDQIRTSNYIKILADYLAGALYASVLFAFLCLLAVGFWDEFIEIFSWAKKLAAGLWVSMLVYVLLCWFRLSKIMIYILRNPDSGPR